MKESASIFRGFTLERRKSPDNSSAGDAPRRRRSTFKFSISNLFKRPKKLTAVEEDAPKKVRCFSLDFWRRPKSSGDSSSDLTAVVTTDKVVPGGASIVMSECECTRNNVNDDSVSSQALGELRKTLQSLVNEVRNDGFELTSLIRQSLASARTDQAVCGQLSNMSDVSLSESGDCLPMIQKCSKNADCPRTEDAEKSPLTPKKFMKAGSDETPADAASLDPDEAGLSAKLQIISKNLRSLLGEVKHDSTELATLLRLSLISSKGLSGDQTVAPAVAPLLPSSRDLNDLQRNVDNLANSFRSEAQQIKSMVCESLRRRSQTSLKDETNWNVDYTPNPYDNTLISAPLTANRCTSSKNADVDINGAEMGPCGRFAPVQRSMQCTLNEPDRDGDSGETDGHQGKIATSSEDFLPSGTQTQLGINEGLRRLRQSIGDLAEVVRSENQQLKSVLHESLQGDCPSSQIFEDRGGEASLDGEHSLTTENSANSCAVCHQDSEALRDLADGMGTLTSKIQSLKQVVYNGEETKASLLRRLPTFSSSSLAHRVRTSGASQTAADEKLEESKRSICDLTEKLNLDRKQIKSTLDESMEKGPIISIPVTIQVKESTLPVENTIQSESLPAADLPTRDDFRADASGKERIGSQASLMAVLEVVARSLLALADEVHRNSLELTTLMRQSIPSPAGATSSSAATGESASGSTHEGLARLKSGINELMLQIQNKNVQMKTIVQEWLKGTSSSGRKDGGSLKKAGGGGEQNHSQVLPATLSEQCGSTLRESSLPLALDMLRTSVRTLTDEVHNSTAELTSLLRNSVRAASMGSDQPDRTEALQELLRIRQSIVALAEEVWSKNKRIKSALQSSIHQSSIGGSPDYSQRSDCTSCESLSLSGTEAQLLSPLRVSSATSKLPHPAVAQATEELRDIKKSIRELAVVVHSGKKQIKEVLCEALMEKKADLRTSAAHQSAPSEPSSAHQAKEASSTNAVLLTGLDRLNASMRSLANSLHSMPEFTQNARLTAKPTCLENRGEGIQATTDQSMLKTLEEVKKSVLLISGAGQGDKPNLIATAPSAEDKETGGAVVNTSAAPPDLQHSLLLKVLETTRESLRALGRVSAPEASLEAARKNEIMQLITGMQDSLRSLREEKRWCEEAGEPNNKTCSRIEDAPRKVRRSIKTASRRVDEPEGRCDESSVSLRRTSVTSAHKKTGKKGKAKRRKKNVKKRLEKRDLEEEDDDDDRGRTQGDAPANCGSHMACHHQMGYPQRVTTSYYAPPPMAPPLRYWRFPPHTAAIRWPPRSAFPHMPMVPPAQWDTPVPIPKASTQMQPAASAIKPPAEVRRRQ
ncbi:hypothetical protein SprV_0902776600 [Sparganum proliferum]